MLRRLAAGSVLLLALLAPAIAHADGRAELEKARAAYLARNYTEAEERLRALTDPSTGLKEPGLIDLARMNLGAVLLAQGKKEAAQEVFEKLVLEDPAFEPDPLSFPGDTINTFIDVRSQLRERIKAAAENAARLEADRRKREAAEKAARELWLKQVSKMAEEEKITVRHSRLVACLPFGVGQFQNGQPALGWTFLGIEAAAVGAFAVTIPMYAYARSKENEFLAIDIDQKGPEYHQRAVDLIRASYIFFGAFAVAAVIGVVQANAVYVPEKVEIKKRELPPLQTSGLKLTPTGFVF
jgi:tetratricopeptide (TPR) repeat protein